MYIIDGHNALCTLNDNLMEDYTMKIWRSALAGALLMIGSTATACAATPYVSGSVGIAMMEDSDVQFSGIDDGSITYDAGMAATLAAGLDMGYTRIEGEVGYQENGIEESDDVEVAITTFMVNGYYDFELPASPIKPYISAGIGVADVNAEELSLGDDSSLVLAGQLGAGVGFAVAPALTLDARYRYLMTTEAEFNGDTDISIGSHNVMLGLRLGL
ncbi:surface antigen msp4 family protein [Chlorobium limicola DSM 245]|uniref:Surface antigen msp4 family protein n=1 Tax=Chlorobium limicola (strain DSM 245 / NBRC 103803 / 6330) TaxID=290315 RepID=B3EEW2_CHLL2|nr:acyloxyacyl hydrolase [Chlorobium limicola]ACD89345.1 surface antigen msp4 family protein [Chlorobium limicola DSM 245]